MIKTDSADKADEAIFETRYTGEFRDDQLHGFGIYEFGDGRRYEAGKGTGTNQGSRVLFFLSDLSTLIFKINFLKVSF